LNWDDYRFFLALARAGTVSGAGRQLDVKHTTVARRINALEKRIGARLFDHLSAGYVMTSAGKSLHQHALLMEEQAQAIDRNLFGIDNQLTGPLALTAAHDVLTALVVPFLEDFKHAYPKIDLQLLDSASLKDLSARQADIALRVTPNPPDYLIGRKIVPLTLGVYASRRYLETHDKLEQVILWSSEDTSTQWVKTYFPSAEVVIRGDSMPSIISCVTNHLGLARIPCFLADTKPDLLRIDVELTPSEWGIWVLSHVDLRSTAKVRACREFLGSIIEQQRELISGAHSQYWRV